MDDEDKNKRSAGNTRFNAALEKLHLKHVDDPPIPEHAPVPIVQVPDDDPRFVAAVAEANQRVEEFLDAFADRGPADVFAVKAPFRDDFGKEYMWLTLSQVDEEFFIGLLDNDPACVKAVRRGQRVKVPRNLLNDWFYVKQGEPPAGGFTVKLMEQKED
jgi:uncharacterized protein YegJ (DUF2314 family)